MTTRDLGVALLEVGGLGLLVVGSFLASIPLGIAVCGLALLILGLALDRS